MSAGEIFIKGAREHNLKNIDLRLPRDRLIVVTGISGSGKSSLAFDTIYAEGQRRYMESLSSYARQFLGRMDKPDVDSIDGLSPTISIDQKGVSHNPRSTVGTVTEIYDYLRLLFARIGVPHCPKCGKVITTQTVDQMVDQVMALPAGTRFQIMAPLVRGRKGEYHTLFDEVRQKGFSRIRVDGDVFDLGDAASLPTLEKYRKHSIEVVVDRLVLKDDLRKRLADSLETTLKLSGGLALVDAPGAAMLFSEKLSCHDCGVSFEELQPRLFSFNSPYGACPTCTGIGHRLELDEALVVPDPEKSILDGAIIPWGRPVHSFRHHAAESWYWYRLQEVAARHRIDLRRPFRDLDPWQRKVVLYGDEREPDYEGAIRNLERRYKETESEYIRSEIEKYMSNHPCPDCGGARLKPEALAVTVGRMSIAAVTALTITRALEFVESLDLTEKERIISHQIMKEIRARLNFLRNVGLDYLSLSRTAGSLAGGEAQRIRLATQIGSGLVGVLYILDEPSIGLHQRDNKRLLDTLLALRDLGNTLVVVEHDEQTIRSADFVVDIGPGAGRHGGRVVAAGSIDDLLAAADSITGRYLTGELAVEIPPRRKPRGTYVEVAGARHNNLKNIDVRFPLGVFVCVTGVSGSGKSSLVNEILHRALNQRFHGSHESPGEHDAIRGVGDLDKVVTIDQSPIGRTPRSNPATYTGAFDPIRHLFAATAEARMRGYSPGRFSFNLKGGRCEACQGQGILQIEMHFLPDVYVPCEVCKGKRYNRETLEALLKGKSIHDVLEMTVDEALGFFENIPQIHRKLESLSDVGLGYIHLGQPATTLSGGEAQRVKLATELSRRATGSTLYILDEPTTGLHFYDVHRLLEVLHRLVDGGNTVIVIEHNLDVIKSADYLIDLGPEGGDGGGAIVCEGTPEEVAAHPTSHTGRFLGPLLGDGTRRKRSGVPARRSARGKAKNAATAQRMPAHGRKREESAENAQRMPARGRKRAGSAENAQRMPAHGRLSRETQ